MTKFYAPLIACLVLVFSATSTKAVTISVEEMGSGMLGILVDTAPENYTFGNGGLDLRVSTSNPGVIAFSDAAVMNPLLGGFANRWASVLVQDVTADSIGLLRGASLNTPGLGSAIPGNTEADGRYKFATINYTDLNLANAQTDVIVEVQNANGLINAGADVSGDVAFESLTIGNVIPEPGTFALAGLSLIGFAFRRR